MCKSCGKSFIIRKVIDSEGLWRDCVFGKQTIFQLSESYGISPNTVRRKLDSICIFLLISSSKSVIVLVDTTCWGRNLGVVVLKDTLTKHILWRKIVRYETLAYYKKGIDWLEYHKFNP